MTRLISNINVIMFPQHFSCNRGKLRFLTDANPTDPDDFDYVDFECKPDLDTATRELDTGSHDSNMITVNVISCIL